MRSVLVSVRDLARSVTFYNRVLGLHEVAREGQIVVLGADQRTFTVTLREATSQALRHGQEEVGPRAVCFDVGSQEELEAVAERLEAEKALTSRSPLQGEEPFAIVAGRDPDGLPLLFLTYGAGAPLHPDHYRHVALRMYGVDL